jgi:O-antigen/teichoic acid export membrane protein
VKLHTNFVYNLAGALLPIGVSLIAVPVYIHVIGTARYGVVSITWLLLGYFGFLDFGLSRASANALSKLTAPTDRSPVLVTAFVLNVGLGTIGGAVMFFAGRLLLAHAFHLTGSLRDEAVGVTPWIAAMLPLGMIYGVANGALESRERFALSNAFGAFGTVVGQLVPLVCAVLIGPSLEVVIPACLLSRLAMTLATYAVVIRIEWPVRIWHFSLACGRRLFGYGSWVTVSGIASPILESFDQMLIGAVLGASAVAYYTVPMNLAMRSQFAATALARTLFPQLSRAGADQARATTRTAVVTLAYGFGAVCAPAILFCGAFLKLWVGHAFGAVAAPIAAILLFGAWTNGLAFLPYGLLQAQGRPDITAKMHLVQLVPFLASVWGLMKLAGLPGAALAWSLRVTLDGMLLYWLSGCLSRDTLRLLPAAVLMLGCSVIALLVPMSLAVSAVAAAAMGVLFMALGLVAEPALGSAARRLGARLGAGRAAATVDLAG